MDAAEIEVETGCLALACDSFGLWYPARVLNCVGSFCHVAAEGIDSSHEEWISCHSGRIAPFTSNVTSVESSICSKCRKDEPEDLLLLCDGCNFALHTFCVTPPLEQVPEGQWFCSSCNSGIARALRIAERHRQHQQQRRSSDTPTRSNSSFGARFSPSQASVRDGRLAVSSAAPQGCMSTK